MSSFLKTNTRSIQRNQTPFTPSHHPNNHIIHPRKSHPLKHALAPTHIAMASSSSDDAINPSESSPQQPPPPQPRDDDVLPDSLTDALQAAANSTHIAMERGCERCIVEILLPEFWDPLSGPVYAEEGDQQRFWKLTRRFIDDMVSQRPSARVKAVYPDAGVAAMLRNQWTDAQFTFSSLNDRKPFTEDDDIIVIAAPDPPGLQSVMQLSSQLKQGQSIVMFNPRLASGDVGVGLNIRRLRESFLKDFITTYSLRPIGDIGSVFRRYPGMWQVFVQDENLPGRYKLAAERPSRPGGEALDFIIMEAMGGGVDSESGEKKEASFVDQIGLTLNSLQRFMKSLSQ